MESTLKEEKGCQKFYNVKWSWEEVEPHFHHALKEVRAHARIPGFRPGKAPDALLKAKFKKELHDEVIEHALPEMAMGLMKAHDLDPVVEPYAAAIEFQEGGPLSCDIVVELAPVVPAVNTDGLSITCHKLEANQEQVDRLIEGMRERAAVMKPVEDAASDKDYAVVQLRRASQSKGQEKFFQANGQSDHPVERALFGRKAGEKFEVHIAEPAAGEEKKSPLAPGDYVVEVTRLVRREVPELNDDFAKDTGAKDLADLKANVEASLKARAEAGMKAEQRDKAVELLLERHSFPIPPTLVDRQLREDLQKFAESLSEQGVDVEKADIHWDKMAESQRQVAEKKVRAYYLLDALCKQRGIAVTDGDLDTALEPQAKAARMTVEQLKARLAKEDALEGYRRSLAHGRAVDLLLSGASVTFEQAPGGPDGSDTHGGGADKPR